jgi:hypothetical protein
VLVSETALNAGEPAFGFFEFALVGVPLLLGTIAIVALFGQRLLPARTPRSIPPNLSGYARTIRKYYQLPEGLVRLRVEHGSPLVGTPRAALDLEPYASASLVGVYAAGGGPPVDDVFYADDILVVRGDAAAARRIADAELLAPHAELAENPMAESLISGEVGVAEIVIPPRSAAIGMPVFPGMVTNSGVPRARVQPHRAGRCAGRRTRRLQP